MADSWARAAAGRAGSRCAGGVRRGPAGGGARSEPARRPPAPPRVPRTRRWLRCAGHPVGHPVGHAGRGRPDA